MTVYQKSNGEITLKSIKRAKTFVNGDLLKYDEEIVLHHNDRILFGLMDLFIFHHPEEQKEKQIDYQDVTFEMAIEEINSNFASHEVDLLGV